MYGRAHAKIIPTARYNEVFALQELHTRSIEMRPREGYGVDLVQNIGLGGFGFEKPLDQDLILTTIHDYHQDNPHGCSIICNIPRVAEILNRMLESLAATWERFGTPTFVAIYKPSKEISDPSGTKATEVISSVVTGLEAAMLAKANGQTRDIAAAGDFDIQILGAAGETLDIEVPGRLILEEITSVFGLPSWMLGKHWSTTERLSENEAKLIGENIDELRSHLIAGIRYLFTLRQLLVGRPFDFTIEWDAPSLMDAQSEAQADKTKAEALSANIKANRELWNLGALTELDFVRRVRPDLEEATDAEIRTACPELLAVPPVAMSPFGGGGPVPPGEEPAAGRPNPFGGARSLTYADGLVKVGNGNGRHS